MITRRTALAALVAPLVGCVRRVPSPSLPCSWGTPVWHPEPVLVPTEPWEGNTAMPFSDGVWWHADRQRYWLWYMAGYNGGTALAESRDGYVWTKLGLVDPTPRDSSTVWPDGDGWVRAVFFMTAYRDGTGLTLQRSANGLTWRTVGHVAAGDRSTVYRLRDGRWVLSQRVDIGPTRARQFAVADVFEGPYVPVGDVMLAQPDDDWDAWEGPHLYNLDAAPLGAGYLGLMAVWGGARSDGLPKRNTLRALTSPDGLTWTRGPLWVPETPEAMNIQSCGGCCVTLPDGRLGFYVSARDRERCVTRLLTVDRKAVCV